MLTTLETQMTPQDFLIGDEISVTGKWVPRAPGGLFRKSPDSNDLLREWEDIHADARSDKGVLQTEINHAIGGGKSGNSGDCGGILLGEN